MQMDAKDVAWIKGEAAYEFGDTVQDGDRKAGCEGYKFATPSYGAFMLAFTGLVQEAERTGKPPQRRPNEDQFFFDKFTQEIPEIELLALARIGAGQLKKHWNDKDEIRRLIDESYAFSGRYGNLVLKTLSALSEYASGVPFEDWDGTRTELP